MATLLLVDVATDDFTKAASHQRERFSRRLKSRYPSHVILHRAGPAWTLKALANDIARADYVSFLGHGNGSMFYAAKANANGQTNPVLLDASNVTSLLPFKGKVVSFFACSCGHSLAPALVNAGADAVLGFRRTLYTDPSTVRTQIWPYFAYEEALVAGATLGAALDRFDTTATRAVLTALLMIRCRMAFDINRTRTSRVALGAPSRFLRGLA